MKQIIFLLFAGSYSLAAIGQDKEPKSYTTDKDLSRWVIDVNVLGGAYTQKMEVPTTTPYYLNGINVRPGKVGFEKGRAIGGDVQLGVFFGKNKHWGMGTGVLYLREWGTATLDNFHAEYQSVDRNGFTFRQVVSSGKINEDIKIDNFNIPLVLKYKNRFSKRWGFTADAGALFNLQMKNTYTTDAAFDYEAIYKFVTNESGTGTPVYETAVIPGDDAFLITKNHYIKNNPNGNVQDYFKTKNAAGYNVGLDVSPDKKTGETSYKKGSVGFIFQPSFNYFLSDKVALNFGGYYLYQPFKNESAGTYTITGKPGEYSSLVNSASTVQTQSFGGNLGVRFFLGKKAERVTITGISPHNPSVCGLCDGSFAVHGLKAGEPATISYKADGDNTAKVHSGTVNPEGTITVPDLCAGNYTDIKATVGKKSAAGSPVNLVAPALVISKVESTNPTEPGGCDGMISMYGLQAGQKATVTYTQDGTNKTYTNTVSSDNSITLSGLCAGNITNITVESNKCIARLNNGTIIMKDPVPVVKVPVVEIEDSMTQVLFEFDKSTLRNSSYAVIDRTYDELQKDNNAYVTIDGNTDGVGTPEYNQELSERRAEAVKAYLMKKGISESRIHVVANGENDPVAPNSTDEGRSKNRRAELLIKIRR